MKRTASAITFTSALLVTLLLITSVSSLNVANETSQLQWSKTYGAYRARSVVQTADGGYIVGGENATQSFRGYSGYMPLLIKTDSSGELQWGKTYGPEFGVDGDALSVFQTEDLGYVLCGAGWLLKTDSQGNVQWNKTYGQLEPFTAIQASEGGYVMTAAYNFDDDQYVPELLKTDANGNLLWNKTFGTASADAQINAVVATNDGGYAISGSLGGDFWLLKIDYNGDLLWDQTYNYTSPRQRGPQRFISIDNTVDGGYILSGEDTGSAWLIKTNADGEEQWNFNYVGGESGSSAFTSAVELADGGYIAVGYSNYRALLVRTDASGTSIWNSTYGKDWQYEAFSVIATNDGGFVVAGSLYDSVWLAKFAEVIILQTDQLIISVAVAVAIIGAGFGFLIYLIKRK